MQPGPDHDDTDAEILRYMLQSTDPGFTANEIAETFDKTRQWAHGRLQNLESAGFVDSKNPGGRSRWYWITNVGKEYLQQIDTTS